MGDLTPHQKKVLKYLFSKGPMERRSILVDCCAEGSMIAIRANNRNGNRRYYQGSNGAAPMIVAKWMKPLMALGLVKEVRSNDRWHQHIAFALTAKGRKWNQE